MTQDSQFVVPVTQVTKEQPHLLLTVVIEWVQCLQCMQPTATTLLLLLQSAFVAVLYSYCPMYPSLPKSMQILICTNTDSA